MAASDNNNGKYYTNGAITSSLVNFSGYTQEM